MVHIDAIHIPSTNLPITQAIRRHHPIRPKQRLGETSLRASGCGTAGGAAEEEVAGCPVGEEGGELGVVIRGHVDVVVEGVSDVGGGIVVEGAADPRGVVAVAAAGVVG